MIYKIVNGKKKILVITPQKSTENKYMKNKFKEKKNNPPECEEPE